MPLQPRVGDSETERSIATRTVFQSTRHGRLIIDVEYISKVLGHIAAGVGIHIATV